MLLPKEKLCQKPKPPLPGLCARPISRPIAYPDTILGFLRAFRTREPLYRQSDHFLCQEVLRPPGRIHAICPGAHLNPSWTFLPGNCSTGLRHRTMQFMALAGLSSKKSGLSMCGAWVFINLIPAGQRYYMGW